MGILDALKTWSVRKCLGKLLKRGLRVGIAWFAAKVPVSFGVQIDQAALFAGLWALIEAGSNLLKVKLENTKLDWIGKYII